MGYDLSSYSYGNSFNGYSHSKAAKNAKQS